MWHSAARTQALTAAVVAGTLLVGPARLNILTAAEPGTVVFIENGKPLAVRCVGKAWAQAEDHVECSDTKCNIDRLLSGRSVEAGDVRVTARLAIANLASSAATFTIGDNSYFGFAGAHGKVFITGPLFNNAAGTPIGEPADFMQDGVPFQFEFVRQGGKMRVLIDGKCVYEQDAPEGPLGTVGFSPVRSTMRLYDFAATGALGAYKAPRLSGAGADNIKLDPRVERLSYLNLGPYVRLADGSILTVDETRALVSHDEGQSWEETHPIFGAGEKFKIRPERALLRTKSGVIILIFANEAVRHYSWDKEKNAPKPDMLLPSYSIRSLDEGKTWGDLNLLHNGWCGCIQDILETRDGTVVVPGQELLYGEARHCTVPYVSKDDGKSWTKSRVLDIGGRGDHAGAIEGTLEQIRDGRLWMLIRSYHGHFYETFSSDDGTTWTDLVPSAIKSTGSPGKLKRLKSGRLVLFLNAPPGPGWKRREELTMAFSDDDGKTWPCRALIALNRGGRVSYPHVFEHKPGELWVTTMQGELRASLREADFLGSAMKVVAFGDSTTAPRGKLRVYATLLEERLSKAGVQAEVINAGVGGNTTQAARQRFAKDVLAHKPDVVIIQFGINDSAVDVWRKPPGTEPRIARDTYVANLAFFVEQLREQGARPILMTPNPLRWTAAIKKMYGKPPYDAEDPKGFNLHLQHYAEAVRELARKQGVTCIDIYAAFEDYGKAVGRSVDELLLDGMHPNDAGHELVAERLFEVLLGAADN